MPGLNLKGMKMIGYTAYTVQYVCWLEGDE